MARGGTARGWRYHPQRDGLLAEAHARPAAPLPAPHLATRLATLSGEDGADRDREHMIALCRRLGLPEPSPTARWCAADAGAWKLRWERHTEFSTWTFSRPPTGDAPFAETALDLTPADWVAALPGDVLVAANLDLRPDGGVRPETLFGEGLIGASLLGDTARAYTDFRPDAGGMTRFLVLDRSDDPARAGRLALALLEIETYRLMALLAFPLATRTAAKLTRIEERASEIAVQLTREAAAAEDRDLLARLVALAGEAETLNATTSFRFAAARAYHEIVRDRVASLREGPVEGAQRLSEFTERRLAPAMRTCDSVGAREAAAIERIARTVRMLNTRVEVAAEASSSALLASMDRRARLQLRLQQTVESLSVAAISYYALGLLYYLLAPVTGHAGKYLKAALVPLVVAAVWLALRRLRRGLRAGGD